MYSRVEILSTRIYYKTLSPNPGTCPLRVPVYYLLEILDPLQKAGNIPGNQPSCLPGNWIHRSWITGVYTIPEGDNVSGAALRRGAGNVLSLLQSLTCNFIVYEHLALACCSNMRRTSLVSILLVITYIRVPMVKLWPLVILSNKVRNFKSPSSYPMLKTVTYIAVDSIFGSPVCILISIFR